MPIAPLLQLAREVPSAPLLYIHMDSCEWPPAPGASPPPPHPATQPGTGDTGCPPPAHLHSHRGAADALDGLSHLLRPPRRVAVLRDADAGAILRHSLVARATANSPVWRLCVAAVGRGPAPFLEAAPVPKGCTSGRWPCHPARGPGTPARRSASRWPRPSTAAAGLPHHPSPLSVAP